MNDHPLSGWGIGSAGATGTARIGIQLRCVARKAKEIFTITSLLVGTAVNRVFCIEQGFLLSFHKAQYQLTNGTGRSMESGVTRMEHIAR